jgi:acetyltransferase
VEGILICPFQSHEVELSAGRVRDPQFGPVITFGLGGIWIEVLRDISYGIAPLSLQETEEMISSIRGHSVLEGKRGKKPAYCHTLGDLLARLSEIVVAEEAIREIDLNPLFPLEKGAFIADLCMIVLGKGSRHKDEECCQL